MAKVNKARLNKARKNLENLNNTKESLKGTKGASLNPSKITERDKAANLKTNIAKELTSGN